MTVRLDWEEFLCPLLLVSAVATVVWLVVRRRRHSVDETEHLQRIESRLRDLTIRVHDLERRAAAPSPVVEPPPESAAPTAAAAVAPPAPQSPPPPAAPRPSEWIETRAAPAEEPPPLPPPPPAAPEPPRPAPRAPAASFEAFVGGRVMLFVGVVVALIGIGFFLKYMIDRGFIGPAVRVGMGVVAGAALLVGGERLRRRGFDVFGQALMGCGLGALYLSNYFACKRYEFFDRTTAFALTAALTALGASLAIWRSAPLLAYLGLLGGYLAPAILGDRRGELVALVTWLHVIDVGALVVSLRRPWRGLDLLSLAFSAVYVGLWLDAHGRALPIPAENAFGCVAMRVAAIFALALVPALVRRATPGATGLLAVAAAGGLFAVAGHELLFPEHRIQLGIGIAAAGAVAAAASRLVLRAGDAARGESEALLGIAVGALAIAVATVASGNAVAPALSLTGLALVFTGSRVRHAAFSAGGAAMILLAMGDVCLNRLGLYRTDLAPFANERFPVVATPCVAMLAAGSLLRRTKGTPDDLAALAGAAGLWPLAAVIAAELGLGFPGPDASDREMRFVAPSAALAAYAFAAARFFGKGSKLGRVLAFAPLGLAGVFALTLWGLAHHRAFTPLVNPTFAAGLAVVAACVFAARADEPVLRRISVTAGLVYLLFLVASDLHAWGEKRPLADVTREEAEFAALVWISVAWAVYGAALVAVGFLRREAPLRWMGLAVFALTLGKVFLVDMAQLEAVYRIGSFLALGALLVAASFLYQRARRDAPGG